MTPGAVLVDIGREIWLAIRPWRRLKIARNKRRARLGKTLLTITKDDDMAFPKGTMTKGGIVVVVAAPLVGIALHALGIGDCSPEQIAEAVCQSAEQIQSQIVDAISLLMTGVGSVIAWIGRNRAAKNAAAAIAAAKQ